MNEHQRFIGKIKKDNNTGCWNWISKNGGYGTFSAHGKPVPAHRFSYEYHREKIPKGMVVDHLCKNTSCVNPDHLEIVTQSENLLRGNTLTAENAKRTHCKQGHEFTKENTLTAFGKTGRPSRKCKKCSYQARKNWTKKNYKHVLAKNKIWGAEYRKRKKHEFKTS